MNNNESIYNEITNRFIAKLEAGTIPWRKPWEAVSTSSEYGSAPRNLVSKKAYRGINTIILGMAEFISPWWVTFKQCKELGGMVKAGSKSNMVVYFKLIEKTDKNGKPIFDAKGRKLTFPILRYSRVFNTDQCEGLNVPADDVPVVEGDAAEDDTIKVAKQIADNADLCDVRNGGDKACYSPVLDVIRMPEVKAFDNAASYFHTLFHEFGHATGHASRLNREGVTGVNGFGSENYSQEELVAEMTASFVSNFAGILTDVRFNNAASYIANWLEVLKNDNKFVIKAASAAQRAADWILGVKKDENEES